MDHDPQLPVAASPPDLTPCECAACRLLAAGLDLDVAARALGLPTDAIAEAVERAGELADEAHRP